MLRKVDFMVIGAQKSATTTICRILADHPDVDFSVPKETHYFSKCQNWRGQIKEYHKHFKTPSDGLIGEGSTSYTMAPHNKANIWKDIYEYNPDVKLIYIVRNPYERFISHYMHMYQRGLTTYSIEEAFEEHPIITDTGRYLRQIEPFINQFGREKVHLIEMQQFLDDPEKIVMELAKYLGLEFQAFSNIKSIHENRSLRENVVPHQFDGLVKSSFVRFLGNRMSLKWAKKLLLALFGNKATVLDERPALSKELRAKLESIYEPEISRMEDILNSDLSHWRSAPVH